MSKLTKSLAHWVSKGLIDQQQANAIQEYEATHTDSSWILYGLLVLGAIIIGIGVISLIAANWQRIPASVKLFMDFSTLSIIAFFITRAFNLSKELQFEILLLIFMLLCLASIGLISQIYNTGGELYEALLLWSAITFPVTVFARGKLVHMAIPFIWLGGFITGLVYAALCSPLLLQLFHFDGMSVSMAIPLFCACFILVGKYLSFETGYIRALKAWFFISGLIAVCITELGTVSELTTDQLIISYLPGYLLAVFTAIGVMLSVEYNQAQKLVLLLTLAIFVISFHLFMIIPDASLIYAIFTITILGLISIFVASVHQRQLFNWLLIFVGIRFLILYFQALGGLATTGVGLIISGLIIITMTYYWNKHRTDIANQVERWMQ